MRAEAVDFAERRLRTRRAAEHRNAARTEPARSADLPDWPGFELLSTHPEDEVCSIEVKGRGGQGNIRMQANERKQARHLGERYRLHVVFDCATPVPRLVRVQDPFAKLLARSRGTFACRLSAGPEIEAAEPA